MAVGMQTGGRARTAESDQRMNRAGLIWNDDAGGYVDHRSTNPATGKPYGSPLQPLNGSPLQAPTRFTVPNAGMPRAGGGGGGGGMTSGGGGGNRNTDEMRRKLEELWNQQAPTYDAPQRPMEDDDNAADKAFRNRARERSAHRMKSGVDALDEEMARRGISSASAMSGGHLSNLFRGAEMENAEADRQITESRSARNRQISDSNYSASLQALRDNQQAAVSSKNRLSSLLSFYDMLY